ncbi:hypothetical protein [Demequina aurantiaca]|uniref:hypothetical protein n=1 Tax=Demequina aurantiaca TaxID=676200 RepID=UPI003D3304DC
MNARRVPYSTVRPWTAALIAGALVAGVSGCSWTLAQEPVTYPSAHQATLERDAAALREQEIIDALGAGTSDALSASNLASIEAPAAPAHLAALGGVYVAVPSPTLSPSPFVGSLDEAVAQARDGALETAQSTTDENLALLQSSIGLTHAFALWWAQYSELAAAPEPSASASPGATEDAAQPGAAEPEVTGEATPSPSAVPTVSAAPDPLGATELVLPTTVVLGSDFTPVSSDAFVPATFADLALAHDEARFLYEVIAARSAGTERDDALARRDVHAARADEFAALAGGEDPRQVTYTIPPVAVDTESSRATTARDAEFALGATYATMLDGVPSSDRGWVLNAAFDVYAAGARQSGFTPDQFPLLPGLQ